MTIFRRLLGAAVRKELEEIHSRIDAIEDALDARRQRERRQRARDHLVEARATQASAYDDLPMVTGQVPAPQTIEDKEAAAREIRRQIRRRSVGLQ